MTSADSTFNAVSQTEKRPRAGNVTPIDLLVYAVIVLLGALQFKYYLRTSDFAFDAMYGDLARSLLYKGVYEFNFRPETTLPPGLPLILAAVGKFAGLTMPVLFHVIAVSTTLGLLAAYELLRRISNRGVAATAALLVGSSPAVFAFGTQLIFSDLPYLFLSMAVLWLCLAMDSPARALTRAVQLVLLSAVLVLAALTRSAGIALLAGLCSWMLASFLLNREQGIRRIRTFVVPLALGIVAQAAWMNWSQARQHPEWKLGGWPNSYTAQLRIKNGNRPELGNATLSDLPARVEQNAIGRAREFTQFMTGRWISRFWSSPAIAGVMILIAIGLAASLRNGGQLYDWYFLWHELIYLLWPWDFELRFLLPVVPLACLYVWRGFEATRNFSLRRPELAGRWIAAVAVLLAVCSAAFALHIAAFPIDPDHIRGDRLQPFAAVVIWAALAIVGLGMLKFSAFDGLRRAAQTVSERLRRPIGIRILKTAAILVLIVQVGRGAKQELAIGRQNASLNFTATDFYPDIEAGEWIAQHEQPSTVVMARKQDLVFHYSQHRVVWFPPISDAQTLMEGIKRNHVGVLVVTHPKHSYWLPAEDSSFQSLWQAYGGGFHLVHEGPGDLIFEISPDRVAQN
jgi:hypothetical protein